MLTTVKELQQKCQLANVLHELGFYILNHVLFSQVLLGMTFGQLDAGNSFHKQC